MFAKKKSISKKNRFWIKDKLELLDSVMESLKNQNDIEIIKQYSGDDFDIDYLRDLYDSYITNKHINGNKMPLYVHEIIDTPFGYFYKVSSYIDINTSTKTYATAPFIVKEKYLLISNFMNGSYFIDRFVTSSLKVHSTIIPGRIIYKAMKDLFNYYNGTLDPIFQKFINKYLEPMDGRKPISKFGNYYIYVSGEELLCRKYIEPKAEETENGDIIAEGDIVIANDFPTTQLVDTIYNKEDPDTGNVVVYAKLRDVFLPFITTKIPLNSLSKIDINDYITSVIPYFISMQYNLKDQTQINNYKLPGRLIKCILTNVVIHGSDDLMFAKLFNIKNCFLTYQSFFDAYNNYVRFDHALKDNTFYYMSQCKKGPEALIVCRKVEED